MVRSLLAALFSICSNIALAQTTVLVPRIPDYRHGETSPTSGIMTMPDGSRLRINQKAQRGPDGKLYLLLNMVDPQGSVYGQMLIDPRSMTGYSLTEQERTKILSTTCSADMLYPIYVGKVLECQDRLEVDSRTITNRSRSEFNIVDYDKKGRIAGYCADVTNDDGEMQVRARMCYSPDGKWIRSIELLSQEKRQNI